MNGDDTQHPPDDDEPRVDDLIQDALHSIWVAGYNSGLAEGLERSRNMTWSNPGAIR
jgi:hypothetical protein